MSKIKWCQDCLRTVEIRRADSDPVLCQKCQEMYDIRKDTLDAACEVVEERLQYKSCVCRQEAVAAIRRTLEGPGKPPVNIDARTAEWHCTDKSQPLLDFLSITKEEYDAWVLSAIPPKPPCPTCDGEGKLFSRGTWWEPIPCPDCKGETDD